MNFQSRALTVHAHAHGAESIYRTQTIFPFEKILDRADAIRQGAQNDRAMRNGFISGDRSASTKGMSGRDGFSGHRTEAPGRPGIFGASCAGTDWKVPRSGARVPFEKGERPA